MNHGDVLLVPFPFSDGTGAKVRPVLVVSVDEFNQGNDRIVVPISSRLATHDAFSICIDETASDFASTGLRCASVIKWSKVMTVAKSKFIKRLGRMPDEVMVSVSRRIVTLVSC